MPLLIAFIGVPLLEIYLFLQVGGVIGIWWTLLIVVVTAVLGTLLVRSQGSAALADIRSSFGELRDPSEPLAHGAMILFAGALLLTPGFFTDALGFALLVPPVRRAAFQWLRHRINVRSVVVGGGPRRDPRGGDVIDGDFEDVTPRDPRPGRRPSGWTRD